MADQYVCNLCRSRRVRNPFRAPADAVGAALMRQHLVDAHRTPTPTAPRRPGEPQ